MCCSCHKHRACATRLGVSLERLAEAHRTSTPLATIPATKGRRGRA